MKDDKEVLDRITFACRVFQPSDVWALFSGGDDSLTVTSIAMQHALVDAALHIHTGIGVPETREYVERHCREEGWPLLLYEAVKNCRANGTPDPQIYEELVLQQGFPGATEIGHRKMYNRLKERPLRMAVREHVPKGRCVLLIAGCRSSESERRMGNTQPLQADPSDKRRAWVNPIHDWSKDDCLRYLNENSIERNPVVKNLCKSGECLCGAFAKPGELNAELRRFYPETYQRIADLEIRVKEAGFPWGWDESPPKWWRRLTADSKAGQKCFWDRSEIAGMQMCHSCEATQ